MIIDYSDSSGEGFAFLSEPGALRAWYEKKRELVLGMLCGEDYPGSLYQVGRGIYVPRDDLDSLFGGDRGLVSVWLAINNIYGGPDEAEALDELANFISRGGLIVSLGLPSD